MRSAPARLTDAAYRLHAWAPAHRTVPMPVARRLLAARAARAWREPDIRAQAVAQMRFLIGRTSRQHEVEAVARRYVFEHYQFWELLCRPWLVTRSPVDGSERFRATRPSRQGVIFHFLHHGHYVGTVASLNAAGLEVHAPVHPMVLASELPRDKRLLATVRATGAQTFSAAGSFGHMLDLLDRREAVAIASDVPGSSRSTFLGREVLGASGVWRLALLSGAPVVPVTVRPCGQGQRLRLEPAVDPRDHGDVAELQRAVLSRHEESVLAAPEAYRMPLYDKWLPVPGDAEELGLDDPLLARWRI